MANGNTVEASEKSLEFTALPLIEVALKRVPRTHFPISLPFVLELRKALPGRFDQMLDLDFLEQPPGPVPPAEYAVHTTCGCRLLDTSMGLTVSLQPDMLVVRWAAAEGKDYPRFPAMRDAADEVIKAIKDVGLQGFEPVLVNMAYANRVEATIEQGKPQPSPWPLADAWTPAGVRDDGQAFESQSVLRDATGTDRRVLVQYRQETSGAPPWYLLLTIAGRTISEGESLAEAEMRVHDALIEWFPRLLSKEAKAAYGLKS